MKMNKKDDLGNRMKEFYEDRTKTFLPRKTYTIIRLDGKAFHTYTRGLNKPFDQDFINDMDETAKYLCQNIQGAKCAFVQSDEISIILTDFDKLNTSSWYDSNVQKITSVSASLATAKFNQIRLQRIQRKEVGNVFGIISESKLAMFDSRVFTIPQQVEVKNYLIWRQQDTVRNSIQSTAQSLYSHKELENKNTNELQEMCFLKGVNWNDFDAKLKRGRLIIKETYLKEDTPRKRWISVGAFDFIKNPNYLDQYIPNPSTENIIKINDN